MVRALTERRGFTAIPNWLVHDRDVPASAKAVWLVLASHANRNGRCWPSQETLSEEAGCSVDTVQRSLDVLCKAGAVSWTKRGRGRLYLVVLGERPPLTAPMQGNTAPMRPNSAEHTASMRYQQEPLLEQEPENQNPPPPHEDTDLFDTPVSSLVPVNALCEAFKEWYGMYPRKVAKVAAEKAYLRAAKQVGPDVLLEGLQRQLPGLLRRDMQYRPHPAKWLNQGQWEDDVAASAPTAIPSGRGVNVAAHLLAQDMAAGSMVAGPAMRGIQS